MLSHLIVHRTTNSSSSSTEIHEKSSSPRHTGRFFSSYTHSYKTPRTELQSSKIWRSLSLFFSWYCTDNRRHASREQHTNNEYSYDVAVVSLLCMHMTYYAHLFYCLHVVCLCAGIYIPLTAAPHHGTTGTPQDHTYAVRTVYLRVRLFSTPTPTPCPHTVEQTTTNNNHPKIMYVRTHGICVYRQYYMKDRIIFAAASILYSLLTVRVPQTDLDKIPVDR